MAKFAPEKPAYDLEDVELALSKIQTHTIRDGWKDLIPGKLAFRFYNAGHIIGSVSVLFRITQDRQTRNVLFSGDLGSYKWDFHPTGLPVPPHNLPIDTVLIESTYGGKVRPDFAI
jgi:metallo-beta-lactamase family protein